jgi:hypothetical protein
MTGRRRGAVPLSHLIVAAVRRAPPQVAERLTVLGYSPPDAASLPDDLTSDDTALINRNLDAPPRRPSEEQPSWLDPDRPVPLSHLMIKPPIGV